MEEGHTSCALIHLANASYRLGRTLNFDPETQQVKNDEEANHLRRDGDSGYRPPLHGAGEGVNQNHRLMMTFCSV